MRNIMRAIARLLGLQTKPLVSPVQPTPIAGHAPQEPTQPRGNKRSAQATKPRKSVPAAKKPSSKPKAAQSTKAASSRKAAPKSVPKTSGASGKQQATRASKTRQHAK